MDMLDVHAKALASGNIAYHELLLCYRAGDQVVYGFVEGRDDPSFYRGIIDQLLPSGWEVKLIRAGNKNKVLQVLREMDWTRFPRKRICFFVDRDLADFLPGGAPADANLYVTDKYSIESEIVCGTTFARVLEEVLGLTDQAPHESATVRRLFEENLVTFCEGMAPVMAQILLWRRATTEACLDNVEPKNLFTFSAGRLTLKPEFSASAERVKYACTAVNTLPANEAELVKAENELRQAGNLFTYTRGKYLIWYFVHLCKHIYQESPSLFSKYKTPPKARIELGVGNAVAVAAPRVRCPDSLRKFLDRTFSAYIHESNQARAT